MNARNCWVTVLIAVLLLPNVAVSADPAKEAYEKGKACLDEKDYDAAITALAIRLDRKNTQAYPGYEKKGEYDMAIADQTEVVRLDPKNGAAYYKRAVAYEQKGEYGKAIADFSEVVRLDPKYAMAYNDRGNVYSDKGDLDNAIADHTNAIQLKPDLAEAYNNRGAAYMHKGDLDKAIADYTTAIRFKRTAAIAYYSRGVALVRKGDKTKAEEDFVQAKKLGFTFSGMFGFWPAAANRPSEQGHSYSGPDPFWLPTHCDDKSK